MDYSELARRLKEDPESVVFMDRMHRRIRPGNWCLCHAGSFLGLGRLRCDPDFFLELEVAAGEGGYSRCGRRLEFDIFLPWVEEPFLVGDVLIVRVASLSKTEAPAEGCLLEHMESNFPLP